MHLKKLLEKSERNLIGASSLIYSNEMIQIKFGWHFNV